MARSSSLASLLQIYVGGGEDSTLVSGGSERYARCIWCLLDAPAPSPAPSPSPSPSPLPSHATSAYPVASRAKRKLINPPSTPPPTPYPTPLQYLGEVHHDLLEVALRRVVSVAHHSLHDALARLRPQFGDAVDAVVRQRREHPLMSRAVSGVVDAARAQDGMKAVLASRVDHGRRSAGERGDQAVDQRRTAREDLRGGRGGMEVWMDDG